MSDTPFVFGLGLIIGMFIMGLYIARLLIRSLPESERSEAWRAFWRGFSNPFGIRNHD